MSNEPTKPQQPIRQYPKMNKQDDGSYVGERPPEFKIQELMGMRTHDAAIGIFVSAVSALGKSAEKHASLVSAMFAEIEPRDAVEAMLVSQMTTTHVLITTLTERMTHQENYQVRETYERSVTRLSRTYLAQMDAFKKYRAKAQQTVRVERVNVESGGQAIVGDVSHRGRVEHEK